MSESQELILEQYRMVRDEIQKSIFIQYEVIRIGTIIMGSLLVFTPAIYNALGNTIALSIALLCLGSVSISFVFIMGAGEIRIMRAAAFSNQLLREVTDLPQHLHWDEFVSTWNANLRKGKKPWLYEERNYLAMPFIVITFLSDLGAIVLILLQYETLQSTSVFYLAGLLVSCIITIVLHMIMIKRLLGLSKDILSAHQFEDTKAESCSS